MAQRIATIFGNGSRRLKKGFTLGSVIGSIDLKETRVSILIPFAATSIFAIAQLYLGADPIVVFLCMAGILVTFLPLHFNGRDLYSICAMAFGLRYLGIALVWKTFAGQPLQTHLFLPTASFAWVFGLMTIYTTIILLVRHFDRGVATFAFPTDAHDLRRLAIISFCIGTAALALIGSTSSGATAGGAGGVLIVANTLSTFLILSFVSEACRNLEVSGGRNLFSPLLAFMIVFVLIVVSALNWRAFFLNCVISVALVSFIYKAVRLRYVVIGLLFGAFFVGFMTPVILYVRSAKVLPPMQFFEYSAQTAFRAATDPTFLKYVKTTVDVKSVDPQDVEYDYYGNRANVGNRLSYIALFDSIYSASQGIKPIGMATVVQSFAGVAPGFLGAIKNPESLGDWLGWQTGVIEAGATPFINFGMPMEGYASWGWIGAVTYPFIFFLPYLFIFTKIASFRLPVPVSIFIFSGLQHQMIETTSDGFMNAITRTTIILSAFLFALHYIFFRTSARVDAVPAPAQT